jgi:hypothetical protein
MIIPGVLTLIGIAFAADEKKPAPPSAPPAVTDAQKLQFRTLQNTELQLENRMKQMQIDYTAIQEQGKQAGAALDNLQKTLCPAAGDKTFHLDPQTLDCAADPAKK